MNTSGVPRGSSAHPVTSHIVINMNGNDEPPNAEHLMRRSSKRVFAGIGLFCFAAMGILLSTGLVDVSRRQNGTLCIDPTTSQPCSISRNVILMLCSFGVLCGFCQITHKLISDLCGNDEEVEEMDANHNGPEYLLGYDGLEQNPEDGSDDLHSDIVDQSNVSYLQENEKRLGTRYDEVADIFQKEGANNDQLMLINSFIATNLKELSENGLKLAAINISLQDGFDYIIGDKFDPDGQTEWCLLNHGINSYDLITVSSAQNLIKHKARHPFLNRELNTGDIVRGGALLNLLRSHNEEVARIM